MSKQPLTSILLKDSFGVWLLLTGSFLFGLVVNNLQDSLLPLVYVSTKARLDAVVVKLRADAPSAISPKFDGDVTLEEMKQISSGHSAIIIDARPKIFYDRSHIPSALSLPRDDFEIHYKNLKSTLASFRDNAIIVYCSSSDCQDSQLVAEALQKLGFSRVRVFRGGWDEWETLKSSEEEP